MVPRSDERQPVWSEPWRDEGVSFSFFSDRHPSLSTVSQRGSGGRDEITQALRNICVPFGKYREMRPHYAAEIHCSSAKSISSRAGDKKQLNVLIRSERNSGHNLLSGGKRSRESQWLTDIPEMTGLILREIDCFSSRADVGCSALQTITFHNIQCRQ